MTTKITSRDGEILSAYLDGQLTPRERAHLEKRLREEPQLRNALGELHRTRAILRSQPRLRAPRNFMLTPQMAGIPGRKAPRLYYPVLRLASVMAGLLFVVLLVGDLLTAPRQPAALQLAQNKTAGQVEQGAPKRAVAPTEKPEAYPGLAAAPPPAAPTTAAAAVAPPGAGAPTEASIPPQFDVTPIPTETVPSIAAAGVQKLVQAGLTETAEARVLSSPTPTPFMMLGAPISPTETMSAERLQSTPTLESYPAPLTGLALEPTLTQTLEPNQTPTPEPTQTPTLKPTVKPSHTPTLEPTLGPTPSTPPQPEISSAQQRAYPNVSEPAQPQAEQESANSDRTILRIFEVSIAFLAVAAGLIAIYLRRIGR
jgi:anti-sigma factor RsiW